MRRSLTFTIGAMLCATLAAGAHAQSNQSSGGKTLVDLEAQAKSKKRADGASQPTQTATSTTKTKRKAPAKKGRRTTSAKPAATAVDPASKSQPGAATQAAPASAPSAAAPAAPPDPNGPKIYKAGDIPDAWKFQKERASDKKPVSEGAGAAMTPASDAAPPAVPATVATETPSAASMPAASPAAAPVPAAGPAVSAAPGVSAAPAAAAAPKTAVASPAPATPAENAAEKTTPTQPSTPARSSARAPSGAQGWRDRGYISGNVGWQPSSTTFTDARTLPTPTGDSELRRMTSGYDVKAGPMFDIGVGLRLVKSLGVAVSVTRFSVSNDIKIDGTVPHPFVFNTQRPLSGTTPATREELAVHVDGVWVVPGRRLQVAIFGGPTFFNAKQTVANDFTYNDVYPFDTPPTFTAGIRAQESKTVTGFNVGADVGYFFNDIFGVGGVVRFSRGTLKSSIGDLDLGGPQFSTGVRIRLRQGAPSAKKPPAKK